MKHHPCRGRTDVSCATCWDFNMSWRDRSGAAGMLRSKGLSYGRAFLDLYLPDVVDEKFVAADDERAHAIVLERYMANGRPSKSRS